MLDRFCVVRFDPDCRFWHALLMLAICLILPPQSLLAQLSKELQLTDLKLDPSFIRQRIPINGGHLACYRRPASGPTLLLIPGTFSDSRNYALIVPELDTSFDLVIIENRGLGESWPPPEQPSIELCAADALTVLDTLRIETFSVGGHSLGGMIAMEIGRQNPDRVRAVISIEGWTNARAAVDAFQSDMKSTLTEDQLALMIAYRQNLLKNWTAEQQKRMGSAWKLWDGTSFLDSTNLPVLELYGDRGKPRPDQAKLGIPIRKNIQLTWLAGASHSLLIERPKEVATSINAFLGAIEKTDLTK